MNDTHFCAGSVGLSTHLSIQNICVCYYHGKKIEVPQNVSCNISVSKRSFNIAKMSSKYHLSHKFNLNKKPNNVSPPKSLIFQFDQFR